MNLPNLLKEKFYKNISPIIAVTIFAVALVSRLYNLGQFPFFGSPEYPIVGAGSGALRGLYTDEYAYYTIAIASRIAIYQPWVQLLAIRASIIAFGANVLSVRLPSAVFSSISVILVYLICIQKFRSRTAALLSSVYLIIMMPAFVYNRMAFLENGAVLFFLASYLYLLKYSESDKERYLLLATIFSGLSVLSKVDGLIAPVFLLIYLIRIKKLRQNLRHILLALAIILIFPIGLSLTLNLDYIQILSNFAYQWQIGKIGYEFSIWNYLLINSMPSGYTTSWGSYLSLDYWYIFAYFSLAYIAVKEFEKVSDLIVALAAFIGLFFLVGGIGSYYLIIIQPFLAIAAGYGLTKLIKMATSARAFLYLFLYAPVTLSLDIYLSLPNSTAMPILQNNPITIFLKIANIALPISLITAPYFQKQERQENTTIAVNTILLVAFIFFLFIGSYILPVFYPQYITPTS